MRYVLLLALLAFTSPAFAQDRNDQKPAPVKEKAKAEEKAEAKKADKTDKDSAPAAEEQAASRPPVEWDKVESIGTLSTAMQGALERTVWRGQKRSVIEEMITGLPNTQPIRSVLSLQRRLLLSRTDTSLIENDVGPLRGNDLLIRRIKKLMAMGLYDDAWDLYTQTAEEPYDVSIAQLGMLLLVMKNDLATACLEEKVFAARYPRDNFFRTLDAACNVTIGGATTADIHESDVLNAVYNKETFSVSAANPAGLKRMTDLERALVLANGKIRYDGLTPDILRQTPPALVGMYLMDKSLPDSAKAMIKAETDARGLTWYIGSVARDPAFKAAKDHAKDIEGLWPYLESGLSTRSNPADLVPYTEMLASVEPKELSTKTLGKVLAVFLASGKALPEFWLKQAQSKAPENPMFYIYLQGFKALTPSAGIKVSKEDLGKALDTIKPDDAAQILAIVDTLDSGDETIEELLNAYEKHSGLTSKDNYVMPSGAVMEQLDEASEKKQIGITVMAILNVLAAKPDNMYSGTVRKTLYSMLNVGLIEDAKLIGAETVASVLNKY